MNASNDGWLLQGSADPADVAAYYDDWAKRYDDDLDGWAYRAPGAVAGLVTEHAPDAATVLDAGCGTGRTGRALRSAGYRGELHGVDVSTESLRIADESKAYTSVGAVDLQQPLTYATDAFDALICVGVMTYVPEVEACWREFCRVVQPGGVIVVTQRQDLWEQRDCAAVVERLGADGAWQPLWVSDAEPYLPGNDDFGDQIGVYYVAARVLASP